jgi:uncharacterized iron-regulated membrane protein
MKAPPFRKIHRWIALATALPLAVILITGVLLSVSPKVEWLQPASPQFAPGITLSFEDILKAARTVPEAQIQTWDDVTQVDARPASGLVRVRAQNYWEVQIHGHTGEVVGAAPRRKTLLVTLHDGSWFASWSKLWIFMPTGLGALALLLTGLLIWLVPILKRRKV